MRQPGQIIVFNATKGGFFSSSQRFFTKLPYTHVAMTVGPMFGVDSYFGAELSATIQPFDNILKDETELYQMYRPTGWTDQQIDNALMQAYVRYAGKTYGFGQIAWFMYRGMAERWPFHADVRKQHNWFPNGTICSEIGWWYLWFLYEARPDLADLRDKLNGWRPDTFNAGDAARLIQGFPTLFTLTEERWSGPKMKKVLFLDDSLERHEAFKKKFKHPDTVVTYVETSQRAMRELDTTIYDIAFLDHDLGGKVFVKEVENTGYEVALHIRKISNEQQPYQVIIHSNNPAGAIRMYNALQGVVKKVQMIPFSTLIGLL